MAYTYKGYNKSNSKHVYKYNKEHYKRVTIDFDLSFFNELKQYCDSSRIPVATFIKQAVDEKIASITKK